jgi:hypothetical protein
MKVVIILQRATPDVYNVQLGMGMFPSIFGHSNPHGESYLMALLLLILCEIKV